MCPQGKTIYHLFFILNVIIYKICAVAMFIIFLVLRVAIEHDTAESVRKLEFYNFK